MRRWRIARRRRRGDKPKHVDMDDLEAEAKKNKKQAALAQRVYARHFLIR